MTVGIPLVTSAWFGKAGATTGHDVQASATAFNEMAEMTSQPALNVTDEAVNATAATDDVMSSTWLRVLFVSLYGVVFVLGVSGNSLVVYVICRDKSLQTTTNVFIANLAVSDVVMCLLAVPFTPISGLLADWVFGKVRYYATIAYVRYSEVK